MNRIQHNPSASRLWPLNTSELRAILRYPISQDGVLRGVSLREMLRKEKTPQKLAPAGTCGMRSLWIVTISGATTWQAGQDPGMSPFPARRNLLAQVQSASAEQVIRLRIFVRTTNDAHILTIADGDERISMH